MIGLPYIPEVNDCFQTIRRHFEPLGVTIRDYAFPSDFWDYNDDMYRRLFSREGFHEIDIDDWTPQLHDVLFVAGSSSVPFATHGGVIVDGNKVLHHYTGRLSEASDFKGVWRRPLLVVRHETQMDKTIKPTITDITELVPAHVRARLLGKPQSEV